MCFFFSLFCFLTQGFTEKSCTIQKHYYISAFKICSYIKLLRRFPNDNAIVLLDFAKVTTQILIKASSNLGN